MRKLRIAGICAAVVLVLALVVYAEDPELCDLDIKNFHVDRVAQVDGGGNSGIIDKIWVTVQNNGAVECSGSLKVTGIQNAVPVYVQTQTVTDLPGNGAERTYYQSYVPSATGDILWTAELTDEDPDEDIAEAVTTVK